MPRLSRSRGRWAALLLPAFLVVMPAMSTRPVHAEDFTTKPVRIIVTGPGGSSDTLARVLATELRDVWKHPVIVENKSGVGGLLPTLFVKTAPPDGHTILINTNAFIVSAETVQAPQYNAVTDFVPVAMLGKGPLLLVARADLPENTLPQVIARARQAPDAYTYGSTGLGGITHLSAELFFQEARIKARHIPFKSGSQAITGLAGGQVDLYIGSISLSLPLVKSGRLKALAVTSPHRSQFLPEVPAAAESGLPAGFSLELWWGMFAPAKTPAAIVEEINRQVNKVLSKPAVREIFDREGVDAAPMSVDQFAGYIKAEQARWKKVVDDSGFEKQ